MNTNCIILLLFLVMFLKYVFTNIEHLDTPLPVEEKEAQESPTDFITMNSKILDLRQELIIRIEGIENNILSLNSQIERSNIDIQDNTRNIKYIKDKISTAEAALA